MNLKLGRKAIKTDSRTLRLARYLTAVPPAPAARDWSHGVKSWGMLLNDSLGDCTIAGIGHAIQVWSANVTGVEAAITDAEALKYYEQWDGYVNGDPSTDQGGICLDVLNDFKKQGFAGHELTAFATAHPRNTAEVKQAINLFGGVYIGVSLPLTAQAQVGKFWAYVPGDSDNEPGSWGGHCVFVIGYDAGGLTCITWGALQRMTWNFWNRYVDESYALMSPDFLDTAGLAPNGFNLAALEADLAQIS